MDELERARQRADFALAQARDIANQFNAQVRLTAQLEAKLAMLYQHLQQTECPVCAGAPVGKVLAERDRAVELQQQARAQAEHFLQQRIAADDALDRIEAHAAEIERTLLSCWERLGLGDPPSAFRRPA